MGGVKISMEPIKTEKGRKATFRQRKIVLQKKCRELSILCEVKVGMIMYGPKANSPEIWPENEDEIKEVLKTYKSQALLHRQKRTVGLSDYFSHRKEKAESMLSKIRKQNHEAKYPTWDYRYNDLSEQHMRNFANYLDGKIEAAKARIAELKGKAASTMTSEPSLPSGIMDINACSSSHTNTNYHSNLLKPSLLPSGINMDIIACSSSYNNTNYYTDLLESSGSMDDNNISSILNSDAPNMNYNTSSTNANQLSDSEFMEGLVRRTNTIQLEVLNPQPLSSVNGQVQDIINHAPQQGLLGGGLPLDTSNAPQFMNPSMMIGVLGGGLPLDTSNAPQFMNPSMMIEALGGGLPLDTSNAPQFMNPSMMIEVLGGGLPLDTSNAQQFINPSMMMMMMNCNQPSSSNFMYVPMMEPIYHDPKMLESMSMVPVPMPIPMCYLAVMQPQYVPYPSGTVEGSAQLIQLHASPTQWMNN